ncbi:formate dehydrogenase subunit delta [Sphingomonas montanisoli]|nr:formate dehydrogenase subunit delta [Sphingomonas montanisoli]
MMSTDQRLAYMADQIARNFAAIGHDKAAMATADHIAKFWDPRMKARIAGLTDSLGPVAARAIAILQEKGAPPPQTHATEYADVAGAGHDDAG